MILADLPVALRKHTMNRSDYQIYKNSSIAAVAATSILLACASAHAQTGSKMKNDNKGGAASNATNFRIAPSSVPAAVEPIMSRVATLLLVSEDRQKTAPEGARASYKAAADALRELLTSNRLAPGAGAGGSIRSAPSVSSTQAANDVRTLRAAAKSSTGSKMEMLTKAASLYATGAKEYFTGQLREALFDTNVTAGPAVLRGSGGSGGRRRAGNNQQGGVIQNPPSFYDSTPPSVGPTVGGPLTTPGTTVIAPTLGGVVNGPVIVPVPGGSPVAPVVPAPQTPAPQTPAPPAPAPAPANP